MGVEKMSISFELELGEAVRSAARNAGQSVSSWLAESARDRLRLAALADAVSGWEATFGALTEAEIAEAETALGVAASKRRSKA